MQACGSGGVLLKRDGVVMVRMIIDTDIDTDCDDAGALAVAHCLTTRGEMQLLGVVCSAPVAACAPCVRAINTWYGRGDIPVGAVAEGAWDDNPMRQTYAKHRDKLGGRDMLYNEDIAADSRAAGPADAPEDAVRLYRRLLAAAPDGSVTIAAIGTLTAVSALLRSGPDDISGLDGAALVAAKVVRLVSMAVAVYPTGRDGFNWRMDLPAAVRVTAQCPVPIAVQSSGADVLTGERFMAETDPGNPVRRAYRLWLGGEDKRRSSYDQLTVLYAVRGAGELFTEHRCAKLSIDADTGEHRWEGDGDARVQVLGALKPQELAARVEELMIGG